MFVSSIICLVYIDEAILYVFVLGSHSSYQSMNGVSLFYIKRKDNHHGFLAMEWVSMK